jgi:hypothetical protein
MTRSLERALEVDAALTERQARRQHGVRLEACRNAGLTITPAFIAPTARSSRRRWVNFVSLEPLGLEGFELRHLTGVAEMRHMLRVEPRDWQVLGHAAETSPDAVWQRGLETWAVEYDAGAYTLKTVQRKARAFEAGFDGQVWGVASSERAQVLGDVLGSRVMLVRPF